MINQRERTFAEVGLGQDWREERSLLKWTVVKIDRSLEHVVVRSGSRRKKMTWDTLKTKYARWVSARRQ